MKKVLGLLVVVLALGSVSSSSTIAEASPGAAATSAVRAPSVSLANLEARTRRILDLADSADAAGVRRLADADTAAFLTARQWLLEPGSVACQRSRASRPGAPVVACRIVGSTFYGPSAAPTERRAYQLYYRHLSRGWTAVNHRLIGDARVRRTARTEQALAVRRDRLLRWALVGRFDLVAAEAGREVVVDLRAYRSKAVAEGVAPAVAGGCSRVVASARRTAEYVCGWFEDDRRAGVVLTVKVVDGRRFFASLLLDR